MSKESVIKHIKKALCSKEYKGGIKKEFKDKSNKNAMKLIKELKKKWINPKSELGWFIRIKFITIKDLMAEEKWILLENISQITTEMNK